VNPLFLLAEEHADPFMHTWNTWEIDLGFWKLDLRHFEICEKLGITNVVVMMIVVALLLVVVGVKAGAEAQRALAEGRAPRGIGHVVEVVVDFIRGQVVKPQMPHHFEKPFFNAYFCTLFFFILFNNLIGLVPPPFGHTPTGTFMLNVGLAFGWTWLLILGSGLAEHGPKWLWTGFVPHGVPWWLTPLIWAIEVVGVVIKPFSLTIRLTANMTAGHIILAVLGGFLLLMAHGVGASIGAGASAFGYLAITAFEIAIAFIQAYIFTMLSAVFVGMSVSHEH
jgi:F-type H+-transporting ATPase subunit a